MLRRLPPVEEALHDNMNCLGGRNRRLRLQKCQVVLLANVEKQATPLLAATPRWDHIVTARAYNGALAKSQLLNSFARGLLNDTIGQVGMFKESASSFLCAQGVTGVEDLPAIVSVDAALEAAQTCMTIIACVNVVENFQKNQRGADMVVTILKRSGSVVPEALKKKLSEMAAKA